MENFIAGERRASKSDFMDVVQCVQASNKALPDWSTSTLENRIDAIKDLGRLIEVNSLQLAKALRADIGLSAELTLKIEIPRALASLNDFIEVAQEAAAQGEIRLPGGIAALITSWSEPLRGWIHRLAPALLVGDAVICKLSSQLKQTNGVLIGCLSASKIAPGVVNMIYGQGSVLGPALIQHPGIATISFSGRTETGLKVATAAVENAKKYQLSMGARNAAVIFADTNLDEQMPHILNSVFEFRTSSTTRASRVFVQDAIYKDFLERLKAAPDRPDFAGETSVKNKMLLAQATKQALSETGKLLIGSAKGDLLQPTVIYDLSLCSTVQQDDIEAPFITVSSFKYAHDAIKQANTSPYGQVAYVWTADESRKLKTAAKIEAGRIFFNKEANLTSRHPYCGLKASAAGAEGGKASLDLFAKKVSLID